MTTKSFITQSLLPLVAAWLTVASSPAAIVTGEALNIGGNNSLTGDFSSIAGGTNNVIKGNYTFIGGGFTNMAVSNLVVVGGGYRNVAVGDHATIGGGSGNVLTNAGGFIGGGDLNSIVNPGAVGSDSSIVGGFLNTISGPLQGNFLGGGVFNAISAGSSVFLGGGQYNVVTNDYATLGGGANNVAGGNSSFVGGGYLNSATANQSTVAGGAVNQAQAELSAILGGAQAQATHYGQYAHASGYFASVGDAQGSEYILRGTTANTNATELYLDGASLRMTVPNNSTWAFRMLVAARGTNNSAGFEITGTIKNNGGNTSIVGGTAATVSIGKDVASWNAVALADDTVDALVIKVTGDANATLRWVATVHTTEVKY